MLDEYKEKKEEKKKALLAAQGKTDGEKKEDEEPEEGETKVRLFKLCAADKRNWRPWAEDNVNPWSCIILSIENRFHCKVFIQYESLCVVLVNSSHFYRCIQQESDDETEPVKLDDGSSKPEILDDLTLRDDRIAKNGLEAAMREFASEIAKNVQREAEAQSKKAAAAKAERYDEGPKDSVSLSYFL